MVGGEGVRSLNVVVSVPNEVSGVNIDVAVTIPIDVAVAVRGGISAGVELESCVVVTSSSSNY